MIENICGEAENTGFFEDQSLSHSQSPEAAASGFQKDVTAGFEDQIDFKQKKSDVPDVQLH